MTLNLTKLEQETLNDIIECQAGLWSPAEVMSDGKDHVWTNFWAKPTKGFKSKGYDQHVITKPEWFKGTGRQWSGLIGSLVNKVFVDPVVINEGFEDALVQLTWTQEGLQYVRETFGDFKLLFDY